MPSDSSPYPPELAPFGRSIDLLGEDGFASMQSSFVIIIGLGGVGCHAAAALVRSGIGRVRLIDVDVVSATSLNRHVIATRADIGKPKAAFLAEHLKAINPDLEAEAVQDFFHRDSADRLLDGNPDLVVDAIDAFNPKVALLETCVNKGIKVVSSMGASARIDPSCLRTGDISETRMCPLARVVRKGLKVRGITSGIPVVYSIEKALGTLDPDTSEDPFSRGRVRRRLPSLGVMPGIFGYALASLAIREIVGEIKSLGERDNL
jgi:tRNA A37 threonylcarbamoyladenosine dehydratase